MFNDGSCVHSILLCFLSCCCDQMLDKKFCFGSQFETMTFIMSRKAWSARAWSSWTHCICSQETVMDANAQLTFCFFCFKIHFILNYMYMWGGGVYVIAGALRSQKRTSDSLWSWSYRWFWAAQYQCWDLNLGPLEEKQALLTTTLTHFLLLIQSGTPAYGMSLSGNTHTDHPEVSPRYL